MSGADPIDTVLPLLTKVRKRQPNQWSACCPAHEDNGPSLSIRETPAGAVLLHCFAGCAVADVVAAIGLELHDLFPPRERPAKAPKRTPRLLTSMQALEVLETESLLTCVAAENLAQGVTLTDADRARLRQAAVRIRHVCAEVNA